MKKYNIDQRETYRFGSYRRSLGRIIATRWCDTFNELWNGKKYYDLDSEVFKLMESIRILPI
jgi:hypothetical protein